MLAVCIRSVQALAVAVLLSTGLLATQAHAQVVPDPDTVGIFEGDNCVYVYDEEGRLICTTSQGAGQSVAAVDERQVTPLVDYTLYLAELEADYVGATLERGPVVNARESLPAFVEAGTGAATGGANVEEGAPFAVAAGVARFASAATRIGGRALSSRVGRGFVRSGKYAAGGFSAGFFGALGAKLAGAAIGCHGYRCAATPDATGQADAVLDAP